MTGSDHSRLAGKHITALRPYALTDTVGSCPVSIPRLIAFRVQERERLTDVQMAETVLIAVLEGCKEIEGAGGAQSFPAGSLLLLPAGWRGTVVNIPAEGSGLYRALVMAFPAALIRRALRAHPAPCSRPKSGARGFTVAARPPLVDALLHAAAGLSAREVIGETLVEHRVMEVLLALIDSNAAGLGAAAAPSITEAVRRLVRLEPERSWTCEHLATELNLSRATFNRRMKVEGQSAQDLITTERMSIAASLLCDGGISLHDVAAICGYASSARFASRFRAVTGKHPGDLARNSRRRNQQRAEQPETLPH